MLPVSGAEQFRTSEANVDLAELLGDRGVVEVGELRARRVRSEVREEEVPQSALAGSSLQLVQQRRVAIVTQLVGLLLELRLVRVDVLVHEGDDVCQAGFALGRELIRHAAIVAPPFQNELQRSEEVEQRLVDLVRALLLGPVTAAGEDDRAVQAGQRLREALDRRHPPDRRAVA